MPSPNLYSHFGSIVPVLMRSMCHAQMTARFQVAVLLGRRVIGARNAAGIYLEIKALRLMYGLRAPRLSDTVAYCSDAIPATARARPILAYARGESYSPAAFGNPFRCARRQAPGVAPINRKNNFVK
jgi:hypothetical protein